MTHPRTSCLVNNYNYGKYIEEAIDSVLSQTVPFDEVVIVDDGSSDDSVERIRGRYSKREDVRLVAKSNEGQLSCFNEGFHVATGEILFFLDSDDAYEPQYLEQALKHYEANPQCGFLMSGYRRVGREEYEVIRWPRNRDLGYSLVAAFCRGWTAGGPTSTLSIRRRVLERILPIPRVEDWRIEADNCLVMGAALAGARKHYLALPLVRYRVHGENWFTGKGRSLDGAFRRAVALNRLRQLMVERCGYATDLLSELAHYEFNTIDHPTLRQLRQYVLIVLGSRLRVSRKARAVRLMIRYYLEARSRRG